MAKAPKPKEIHKETFRKGDNSDFYEHDIWNSDCITKLEVLEEHAKKYFDASFRKNIIENFVEGEAFVIYQ